MAVDAICDFIKSHACYADIDARTLGSEYERTTDIMDQLSQDLNPV
jgi:hypothetical protein